MFGKRGFVAAVSIFDAIMGIIVTVILISAAAIPIVQNVLNDANITGIPATILSLIPVFLSLLALIVVAKTF